MLLGALKVVKVRDEISLYRSGQVRRHEKVCWYDEEKSCGLSYFIYVLATSFDDFLCRRHLFSASLISAVEWGTPSGTPKQSHSSAPNTLSLARFRFWSQSVLASQQQPRASTAPYSPSSLPCHAACSGASGTQFSAVSHSLRQRLKMPLSSIVQTGLQESIFEHATPPA